MSGVERALGLLKTLPRVTLGNIKALPGQRLRVCVPFYNVFILLIVFNCIIFVYDYIEKLKLIQIESDSIHFIYTLLECI